MSHDNNTPQLITYFAPPERAPQEAVHEQAASFANSAFAKLVYNTTQDVILIVNAQRQIVFANENIKALFPEGTPLTSVTGLRPGEALGCLHASECTGGCGTARACRECGAVKVMLAGFDGKAGVAECRMLRLVNNRYEALDIRVKCTPLTHEGTNYVVLAITDIGHEKRRQHLEKTFLEEITRQVRTIESQPLFENSGEQISSGDILGEIQSVRQLVNQLSEHILAQRELKTTEDHQFLPVFSLMSPVGLAESLIEECRPLTEEAHCALVVNAAIPIQSVITDPTLLARALRCLVINAIEASWPDEVIEINLENAGDDITFRIHNATVIPHAVIVQMFKRSFSTKSPNRGLGTYTARLIVEQYLRGTINVTSKEGSGTTFTVTLPSNPLVNLAPSTPRSAAKLMAN